jgi:hypothetical protein
MKQRRYNIKTFTLAIFASFILFSGISGTPTFASESASCSADSEKELQSAFKSIKNLIYGATACVTKIEQMDDSFRTEEELLLYKKMSPRFPHYKDLAKKSAEHFHLPATFYQCVINFESEYDPTKKSPRGAGGLTQVMPNTVEDLNKKIRSDETVKDLWNTYRFRLGRRPASISVADLFIPESSIVIGALDLNLSAKVLFGQLGALDLTRSKLMLLVANYNAGNGGLKRKCNLPSTLRPNGNPLFEDQASIDACIEAFRPKDSNDHHETWDEMNRVSECMMKPGRETEGKH